MSTFIYFAYGSNMLLERLQKRCKSARFQGVAVAHGYILAFSKKSKKDGSGKATIDKTDKDTTALHGALFEIDLDERQSLDSAEGPDYERKDEFVVLKADIGEKLIVSTYIAKQSALEKKLAPYDWYKMLILAGAWQGKFPDAYQAHLKAIESIPDPCPERPDRRKALALLDEAGWAEA